jgi:hypothetical protein
MPVECSAPTSIRSSGHLAECPTLPGCPTSPRLEKNFINIYIYNYNINITAGSHVSTCLFSILKVEISINYDETGVKFPLVAARELQILREQRVSC